MEMICQKSALKELHTLSESRRQSVIIEGPQGCGKTYLAHTYANMLNIKEFHTVEPSVSNIRDIINECMMLESEAVLCIENLDTGVIAASYTLLKFFEEPIPNIFIVITCRNISKIPDTIISRGVCVTTCPPIKSDIDQYAMTVDKNMYESRKYSKIFHCVNSLQDVDMFFKLTDDQVRYIEDLKSLVSSNKPVSDMVWALGHFQDSQSTPIELVIRYLMECVNTSHMKECALECLEDLTSGRIASHTVLTRFVFDIKYTE